MSVGLPPAWRDYRNRRRALLGAVAVSAVIAAASASLRELHAGHPSAYQLVLALWATSVVAAVAWFAGFRCPYCARPFHWTWIVANPLTRACLHCGFEKWRDPLAARAYARTNGR